MKATMKKILICLMIVTVTFGSFTTKASAASYSKSDLRYLTAIIYCEAGNQSYKGKVAVANVVLNRVRSSKFPNTIKKVIYQKSQFTPASSGSLKKALQMYDGTRKMTSAQKTQMNACKKAAKAALGGKYVIKKTAYFFSTYSSKKSILKKYSKAVFIGAHYFR